MTSTGTGRIESVSVTVGDHEIVFETGKLAKQAGGAVVVRSGETMVLATAQGRAEAREGADFFPLTVDVEERMYAAGKIPGGFFKREGRPTERAILTARMTDRPIRPLWPKGFRNEVQCIATVLSADLVTAHDTLCINGVSAALMISSLPFLGPVGAVRVGLIDDELVIDAPMQEMQESKLDLLVVGTKEALTMVEAAVNNEDVDGFDFGTDWWAVEVADVARRSEIGCWTSASGERPRHRVPPTGHLRRSRRFVPLRTERRAQPPRSAELIRGRVDVRLQSGQVGCSHRRGFTDGGPVDRNPEGV